MTRATAEPRGAPDGARLLRADPLDLGGVAGVLDFALTLAEFPSRGFVEIRGTIVVSSRNAIWRVRALLLERARDVKARAPAGIKIGLEVLIRRAGRAGDFDEAEWRLGGGRVEL